MKKRRVIKPPVERVVRQAYKKAVTGVYQGIPYDSLEEMAFLQWAFELKRGGYIRSIKRADSYLLCDGLQNNYAQQLVTKSKPMQQCLLHGHSYTPEFEIQWEMKAYTKFIWDIASHKKFEGHLIANNEGVTYIEIKPMFDQNNMERLFKLNQKWMWDKHSLFVNLVKCPELFSATFTPQEYLTTRTGKTRIIKWKVKSLQSFLKTY